MTPYVVLIPVCYLLGSVPFGLLVARIAKGIDVRSYGSGNTGMTNVLRTTGVAPGLAVLVLDLARASQRSSLPGPSSRPQLWR